MQKNPTAQTPLPSDGDPHQDFVSLLTSHQAALRAYIISLMPGDPGTLDTLQEVNILLWSKRETFEIGTNFTAWSFTVARYLVMERRRKIRHDGRLVFSDELVERLAPANSEFTPHVLECRHAALEKCLTRLNEEEREIIDRRYLRGSSLEEYSKRIGKSANSLRVALVRIREDLRKCIRTELKATGEWP